MKWPLAILAALCVVGGMLVGLNVAVDSERERYAIALDVQSRQINRAAKADRYRVSPHWACGGR